MNEKIERIWERTRALRPIIEAHRGEGDGLHHLPDAIAQAFAEANVYRLRVAPGIWWRGDRSDHLLLPLRQNRALFGIERRRQASLETP